MTDSGSQVSTLGRSFTQALTHVKLEESDSTLVQALKFSDLETMTLRITHQKHALSSRASARASTMPSQRKRPTVVDGARIEPEWDRKPSTRGSFTNDTLDRIAQAQAEETSRTPSGISDSPPPSLGHSSDSSSAISSAQSSISKKYTGSRYYAHNLTDEDHHALAVGELNHNLREWSASDLVNYHADRIELVPASDEREERIEVIIREKYKSERLLLKAARQSRLSFVGSPLVRLEVVQEDDHEDKTYKAQVRSESTQSMVDLRAVSTPSLPLSPMSPSSQVSGELFPSPITQASAGRRPGFQQAYRFSRLSSSFSVDTEYVARPDVTFDSFLAPHVSGKGETHKDSDNAKKEGDPQKRSRRLSRVPSMPELKKRVSQTFSFKSKK